MPSHIDAGVLVWLQIILLPQSHLYLKIQM